MASVSSLVIVGFGSIYQKPMCCRFAFDVWFIFCSLVSLTKGNWPWPSLNNNDKTLFSKKKSLKGYSLYSSPYYYSLHQNVRSCFRAGFPG